MIGSTSTTTTAVKSATRTLDVIEYVVAHPSGVVAQDIAGSLDIPVSSLSYLLATLTEREYLLRDGRRYLAGPGLERLRLPQIELTLADRARPLVRALRTKLNETATFFVRDGWQIKAVVNEIAEQPLRYSIELGATAPLYCIAAGKAMLAEMDRAMLDRYLAEVELQPFTPRTITEPAKLVAELETIRASKVGLTREEYTPGICGLGVAVVTDSKVAGSIGVAMPSARFEPEVEARARGLLLDVAANLSR